MTIVDDAERLLRLKAEHDQEDAHKKEILVTLHRERAALLIQVADRLRAHPDPRPPHAIFKSYNSYQEPIGIIMHDIALLKAHLGISKPDEDVNDGQGIY